MAHGHEPGVSKLLSVKFGRSEAANVGGEPVKAEPTWRVALDQFTAELKSLYGSQLDSVILYGSRARGDADECSDVDTLVLLHPCADFWAEFRRISPVASRISLEHDVVISALPADSKKFRDTGSPLFLNVRREGVRVA